MRDFDLIAGQLAARLRPERVLRDAPMAEYTSFRAGGPAALLVLPETREELAFALKVLVGSGAPYFILGNGTNVLVRDEGYEGVILRIGPELSQVTAEGRFITAEAGALLSSVAALARDKGLSGFEFAGGIPGSIGGAVFMNGGAYGGEMSQVVETVQVLSTADFSLRTLKNQDLAFGYRRSALMEGGFVVVSVTLGLTPGRREDIQAKMQELAAARAAKQPLQYPSAGSFFKRPAGGFAGQLIEEAGLKGLSKGGARISPLHAGFLINEGGATATDILDLAAVVAAAVYDHSGVRLEPEVRIIGGRP